MHIRIYIAVFVIAAILPVSLFAIAKGSRISVANINMFCGFTVGDKISDIDNCSWFGSRALEYCTIAEAITTEIKNSDPDKRIAWMAKEISNLKETPDFIVVQEAEKIFSLMHLWPYSKDYLEKFASQLKEATGFKYDYINSQGSEYDYTIINIKDRQAIFYKEGWRLITPLLVYAYKNQRQGKNNLNNTLMGARFEHRDGRLVTLFSTHLETFEQRDIRLKQVSEAIGFICGENGAAINYTDVSSEELCLFAGDFNCDERDSSDGTYNYIIDEGFTDTFRYCSPDSVEITCCNLPDLTNEKPIAHYFRPELKTFSKLCSDQQGNIYGWNPVESRLIFTERYNERPYWPSDHLGVVTVFEFME